MAAPKKKPRVNQCRELLKAAEPLLAAALAPAGLTLERPRPADPGLRCFGRDDGVAHEQYAFNVMRWSGAAGHEFEVAVRLRVHRLQLGSEHPWTINTLLDDVWGPDGELPDRVSIRSARALPGAWLVASSRLRRCDSVGPFSRGSALACPR